MRNHQDVCVAAFNKTARPVQSEPPRVDTLLTTDLGTHVHRFAPDSGRSIL
jgi:hypothetical protein